MVLFRPFWNGVPIAAGGFAGETADAAIAERQADAVAFGRIFISNPDLPRAACEALTDHAPQPCHFLWRRAGRLYRLSRL
jgi:2,4-dienoyl-CoA reductase-like NADH-dependent reductase (Old Yellow Enzyme family)